MEYAIVEIIFELIDIRVVIGFGIIYNIICNKRYGNVSFPMILFLKELKK